jgi:hypothetical protein
MAHDVRVLKHEDQIEELKKKVPEWGRTLKRPVTPTVIPRFGPLEGIRIVTTGTIVAQPYIGTKLAEFGAEVIHVERPGGDPFRSAAPLLTHGPREHGCDEADVTTNNLSMGLDLKHACIGRNPSRNPRSSPSASSNVSWIASRSRSRKQRPLRQILPG